MSKVLMNLLDVANDPNLDLEAAVAQGLTDYNPVLAMIGFMDAEYLKYAVEEKLPEVGFRAINEGFKHKEMGEFSTDEETVALFDRVTDLDYKLVERSGGAEYRAAHLRMEQKAASLFWLRQFFDGDTVAKPTGFNGLKKRIIEDQEITAGSGGGALTCDLMDQLHDKIDTKPDVFFMDKELIRVLNKDMRAQGQATETIDTNFGKRLYGFGGIPIVPIDKDNLKSPILGFSEDDGEGNTDTASVWAVRFGLDGVHGIQNGSLSVKDEGRVNLADKIIYRSLIDWETSIVVRNPEAIARIKHVNKAA